MSSRPTARDHRRRTHVIEHDRAVVTDEAGRVRKVIRLDDPLRPGFLNVARLETEDGGSLRREAFEVWAAYLRSALWDGVVYQLPHVPARPVLTVFAVIGGLLVAAGAAGLLVLWGATPRPNVRVDHGVADLIGAATGLAMIVGLAWLGLASAVRAWAFRAGRFAILDRRGLRTEPGRPPRPIDSVRSVRYHPFARLVTVSFEPDGHRVRIPLARDTLPRLDCALAALDERHVAALQL